MMAQTTFASSSPARSASRGAVSCAALVAAAVAWHPDARAQDAMPPAMLDLPGPAATPAPAPAAPPAAEAAPAAASPAAAPAPEAVAAAPNPMAHLDTAEGGRVHVVQERRFQKAKKIELVPILGTQLNNKFSSARTAGAGLGYHFSERLSIQGEYLYVFAGENAFSSDLYGEFSFEVPETERRLVTYYTNFNLNWTVIDSKFSLLSWAIIDLDVFLTGGAGFAASRVKDQRLSTEDVTVYDTALDDKHVTANLGAGFRFWVTDWFNLRFDFRDFIYATDGSLGTGTPGATAAPVQSEVRQSIFILAQASFLLGF